MDLRDELIERFFRYLAIESQSDAKSSTLPSTPGQARLAALLHDELKALGLADVTIDDHATVVAVKHGSVPDAPRIGFIAHLDTVDVGLSPVIRPQILRFEGADLCLNRDRDIWLRVDEHAEIRGWEGEDIIFGDGTSVLGADNKAAIAVIMTLLNRLEAAGPHGDIYIAFVPDEEIGLRGAKALDLARFPCDFAYTIDCCEQGEVVFETFNAARGEIVFTGVSAHPMSAKGFMVNPLLMAMDFIARFDRSETPERTAGREGYIWFKDLIANDTEARLTAMIRDFDKAAFEGRKRKIAESVRAIGALYPAGKVTCAVKDQYHNINDYLGGNSRPANLLVSALESLKIQPKLIAMRGGTDGSALSGRGLPTPNFFTGAYNFHSRFEFLPVRAFEASFNVALTICRLAANEPIPR
ncbi:peptidase T [Phyllobacterium endophyticum]|uniref:Peptidase T n=1 Tax=Phyllobacterium endophyticum TaxID=1149773 RepID=A0A2P7ASF5_9HYPH|nr:peptidase T [Phyllobacterium endophyticum]MBB3236833.1 tripeptide aminopeptidase [Phyllobacterium endophyticum]PSH57097.1 peptidase T [Phyllobacterium endophyticum]TYR40376.1 peptidase T [Phyllobacterium endophyticum]